MSHENSWCVLFVPALLCYLAILTSTVNNRAVDGVIASDIFSESGRLLFAKNTAIEVLATGLEWSEGPLWVDDAEAGAGYLVFSDTITNKIWKYDEGNGLFTIGKSLYINESGCSVNETHCAEVFEPGSNGITRYPGSDVVDLVLCQHGERAITMIYGNGTRKVIADRYKGKKLNSPNDVVWSDENNLYFTDPPYGLYDKETMSELVNEEIGHYGVYMIRKEDVETALRTGVPTENVVLLDNSLSRPNGIAFSPDYRHMYVANSDSTNPIWLVFDVDRKSGLLKNRRVLADATEFMDESEEHSAISFPDGLKVSSDGIIVSSAPGGIFLLSPGGSLIQKIKIPRRVSNVAFGADGYLFVTAQDAVLRIKSALESGIEPRA
ncbi:unnamed protein product [Ectocarpus fasciculatus]